MRIASLFALNAAHATTLVIVTHDTEMARRAQRVIRLRAGAIVPEET
jgi:putative ABC transport system ATP-binding protein